MKRSARLEELPPYIFAEIDRAKAEAVKKGKELLSLGIGDPDRPTPELIVEALGEAAKCPENHQYSPYNGTEEYRRAVAQWFEKRFHVRLNAQTQVLALIGSKEGIAHFPVAFCNPGDCCLYPSPGYPAYSAAIGLAGAKPIAYPLRAENGFVPDPAELDQLARRFKPKLLFWNFPSNPTSVICPLELLKDIVELSHRHGFILAADNAYSEIYFDDSKRPLSILEVEGAKDVAIEFHSFSKTYNMAGWRIGFAVGSESLVSGLLQVKTNMDSGPLRMVQKAATVALEHSEELSDPIRRTYRERRDILVKGLAELGLDFQLPQATFFVWARVPGQRPSLEFCKDLLDSQGLVVTPGIGFGKEGEFFFRMALTVEKDSMEPAVMRLKRYLQS